MKAEILTLALTEGALTGEVALEIAPGTEKEAQGRALDALLGSPLIDLAGEHGVTVTAAPRAFAHPIPGRDPEGRTIFELRGRVEGDFLVPRKPEGSGKNRALLDRANKRR